jgi:hypothetical protein
MRRIYAANLFNLPTVAYSGEIDPQMQAARMMEKALAAEGMTLKHVIGPGTPHRYHPDSKVEIARILDALAEKGRDPYPRKIRFTTFTLRYNQMKWLTVDSIDEHWERARVDAEVGKNGIELKTSGVSALTLSFGPGGAPFEADSKPTIVINGQRVATSSSPSTDGSWAASFHRTGDKWSLGAKSGDLRKKHGLQGPVDDAFMDSFIFVKPTGTPAAPGIAKWVAAEQAHAITEWRRQYRGDPQVRDDSAVTDADIANSNLVLWGDPGSNKLLSRIADRLPVKWVGSDLGSRQSEVSRRIACADFDLSKPAQPQSLRRPEQRIHIPRVRLPQQRSASFQDPDWAIVDATVPPDERFPGKIVGAGFFGESWELKPTPAAKRASR